MNAHSLAQRAYADNLASTRTERDTEYRLIAQISHRMRTAAKSGPLGFAKLAEALEDNRRLWSTLAIDVAHPDNALPKQLRAQIFYLAEFVQTHTPKVLSRKASIAPLLEINAAILKGLSGKVNTP